MQAAVLLIKINSTAAYGHFICSVHTITLLPKLTFYEKVLLFSTEALEETFK
jgi:hypothetical protein